MSEDNSIQDSEPLIQEYIVEKILNKRGKDSETEYLIKWQNFPEDEATWESITTLEPVRNMIEDFESQLKLKEKDPRLQTNQISGSQKNDQIIINSPEKLKDQKTERFQKISNDIDLTAPRTSAPVKDTKKEAKYENDDSVEEVMHAKRDEEDGQITFLVKWKNKTRMLIGQEYANSWLSSSDLRIHNPEVLTDFLLRKIKWQK